MATIQNYKDMKKSCIIVLLACLVMSLQAQQTSAPESTLALRVLIEEPLEPAPPASKQVLENKLNNLLTQNGIASMDYLGQFFITAKVVPMSKDILAGPPTKISESMEVVFYIADYYNQLVFSTTSATVKGIGETESKCYLNALKQVKLNTPEMKQFVQDGKKKIIEYYNTQADKLIAKAQMLAKQREYEQAMWIVSTIPAECDKYNEAIAAGLSIYQQYIDHMCDVNLAKARTTWAAGQDAMAADAAGEYLSQIYPDAKCYSEAVALYEDIRGKVLADWKFEMKKHQDNVDLELARIHAMRDVGVAYGKGQQPITTHISSFLP